MNFLNPTKFEASETSTELCLHLRRLPNEVSPLDVYASLKGDGDSFLFETTSKNGETFTPSYSYIGFDLTEKVAITGHEVIEMIGNGTVRRSYGDPLDALRRRMTPTVRSSCSPPLPPFTGGLFGYFGFEAVSVFEPGVRWQARKSSIVDLPDILQWVCRDLVVFDHKAGIINLIAHSDGTSASMHQAEAFLDRTARAIDLLRSKARDQPGEPIAAVRTVAKPPAVLDDGDIAKADYEKNVDVIRDYIIAGDTMQVVLARLATRHSDITSLELYRVLTTINPSPYSFHLQTENKTVVGASPEMLVRSIEGNLRSRPLAGTRRRGTCPDEDARLAAELVADEKETAEHVMLIDLARNDLGRIAEAGSVRVDEKMIVERFSHVMHLASTVSARKRPEIDPIDVIASTFPAGTLSGAPKIRAIEIIRELEPVSRGIYGGSIGFIDDSGDLDQAIAIRTAVLDQGQLHFQAGAGVVFDSHPEREWQETVEKMGGVSAAAALVETTKSGVQGDASFDR
ncbi:anthranilate synthase component I family protein [Rhizorhapis suberifaciens]|uniref:Anthranilate synthase component 1 n=1 Tax=Rhizorhapis suberifaciens TaxID=13656 RepID=A0A840HTA3_9SPHN|nr:anthranilate synthase component I family protein [Rhizorhapis suberifaciens]MBB4640736.1 anthranilate synthase component 1 [Rhizorhapis suberifaciens]